MIAAICLYAVVVSSPSKKSYTLIFYADRLDEEK